MASCWEIRNNCVWDEEKRTGRRLPALAKAFCTLWPGEEGEAASSRLWLLPWDTRETRKLA